MNHKMMRLLFQLFISFLLIIHFMYGDILVDENDVYFTFQIDLRNTSSNHSITEKQGTLKIPFFNSAQNKFMDINSILLYTVEYCFNNLIIKSHCIYLWKQYIQKELDTFEFMSSPVNQSLYVTNSIIEKLKQDYGIESHAQINQDIWTINYFNQKRNGIFVDIGANDGITYSNSYTLEKHLNWTGLLIEPQIRHLRSLFTYRNASTIIPSCAYNRTEMIKFYVVEEKIPFPTEFQSNMLSGISEVYSDHNTWISTMKDTFHTKIKEKYLPCQHIQEILDNYKLQYIDYLSVDTEGSEISILKAIDWSRTYIQVIHIESVKYDARASAYNYLTNLGYSAFQLGGDMAFYKR